MVWGHPYADEPRHTLPERSIVHTVHPAVEETEEEEEEALAAYDQAAYQRELDLWLLESQVPGCTRERAEQAYAQGRENVTRALPLARMATLLADREAMVEFLIEQLPETSREEAYTFYDSTGGDVVDAVESLQREVGRQHLNQPILTTRSRQRLRMRTVFMLALLYRERYGQLEHVVEEALAQLPLMERFHGGTLAPFRTADGSRWTHTRHAGWRRLNPPSLGRAVRATEQLADAAEARGHMQTALRARQTAEGLRAQLDEEQAPLSLQTFVMDMQAVPHDDAQAPPSPPSPQAPPSPLPPPIRSTIERHANGLETSSTVVIPSIHYERHTLARAHAPGFVHAHLPGELERYRELRDQDADNSGWEDEPLPPAMMEASSSSEDDDGAETPTAGTYARPRRFVRATARIHPQDQRRDVAKRSLRIVQEQLDTEMANAAQGIVMSEGAYVAIMNAIKVIWEQLDPRS